MRAILFVATLLCAPAFAQSILPEGKAKPVIENNCVSCHELDQVVNSRMTALEWKKTVNRMVLKGAELTPDQIDLVATYLASYFVDEKVNVNTATADQIEATLQIPPAMAEAVVAYRKANGNFKDLAALEKVNGVDVATIEHNKLLITFQQ